MIHIACAAENFADEADDLANVKDSQRQIALIGRVLLWRNVERRRPAEAGALRLEAVADADTVWCLLGYRAVTLTDEAVAHSGAFEEKRLKLKLK